MCKCLGVGSMLPEMCAFYTCLCVQGCVCMLSCRGDACLSAWAQHACASECRCVQVCTGDDTYVNIFLSVGGVWVFTHTYGTSEGVQ